MDIKIRDTVVNHTAGLSHSRDVAVNTIKKYLDADMSVLEISKLMHKPRFWVEEIIKINDLGSVSRINENNTEAKFYGFLRAGKSLREICAECNKSAGWVRGVIQKYNIDYPVEILYPKSKRTESIFTPNIIQRLTSMINKQTPLPEMSKDAELPKKTIYEWIRKTYGCTIGILYKKMNFAKEYYELAEKCREGAVLSDIYKTHHRTGIRRISEESLAVVKPDKMKLLDEKAPYMLQEGLPAEYIFNSLGVNEHIFYVWLNNRYGTNITGLQKNTILSPENCIPKRRKIS